MKIAVNARNMIDNRLDGIGIVTDEVMKRIVVRHPEDQFDYYFDRAFHPRFVHGPNVQAHAIGPVTRLPVLIRWWLNHAVKRNVVRQEADLFFSPDGFIPLRMKIPKVSMVHDIAYLRYPEHLKPSIRMYYKKWMPRFLAETDHIITVSEFSKRELIAGYQVPGDKISVVYNGTTTSYVPITEHTKADVRKQYADGNPYFVFLGAIHPRKNVITLVRAFEKFKAAYPSDLHLVIAGRPSWQTDDILNAIESSSQRASIHLPGYVSTANANGLVGSAEAMIYPSIYEGFGLPVIEAMACGVPVICSNASSLPEVAGYAALLFDPMDVDLLAAHMYTMITVENVKHQLIQRGFERCKFFSWDKAAEEIYSILKSVVLK